MLRYSCLIIGVLGVLVLLISLITCRLSGFPLSEGAETAPMPPLDRFVAQPSNQTSGAMPFAGDAELPGVPPASR